MLTNKHKNQLKSLFKKYYNIEIIRFKLREHSNSYYDVFVKNHNGMSLTLNLKCFEDNPSLPIDYDQKKKHYYVINIDEHDRHYISIGQEFKNTHPSEAKDNNSLVLLDFIDRHPVINQMKQLEKELNDFTFNHHINYRNIILDQGYLESIDSVPALSFNATVQVFKKQKYDLTYELNKNKFQIVSFKINKNEMWCQTHFDRDYGDYHIITDLSKAVSFTYEQKSIDVIKSLIVSEYFDMLKRTKNFPYEFDYQGMSYQNMIESYKDFKDLQEMQAI